MLVLNAFSFNMVSALSGNISFEEMSPDNVVNILKGREIKSAVGHGDTAQVFSSFLGIEVPHERRSVNLQKGDEAILGQYKGPRLPEGATSLPEGSRITWYLIKLT